MLRSSPRSSIYPCLAAAVLLVSAPLGAADDGEFEGFREDMTVAEFQSAGLFKLTPREMDRLEEWVRARIAEERGRGPVRRTASEERDRGEPAADEGSQAPEGGFGLENEGQQSMTSRIDGEFTGWDGDTVFRLENGQVWKQVNPGSVYHRAYRPEVTITREFFGFRMEVEGLNKRVQVKRIK